MVKEVGKKADSSSMLSLLGKIKSRFDMFVFTLNFIFANYKINEKGEVVISDSKKFLEFKESFEEK